MGAQHFFMHWEMATKDGSSSKEKTPISVPGILVWELYKVAKIDNCAWEQAGYNCA